jgi:heme-degrading monooxygenase HmoA
MFIAMN